MERMLLGVLSAAAVVVVFTVETVVNRVVQEGLAAVALVAVVRQTEPTPHWRGLEAVEPVPGEALGGTVETVLLVIA
jgi:hypothetical protein